MSDHLYETHGAHGLSPARAMSAPLGALSCPYSHRDAARHADAAPRLHRRFRSFGPNRRGAERRWRAGTADHGRRCDVLTTDYWNPPVTPSQHARQRILAVIVALVLAVVLVHVGW